MKIARYGLELRSLDHRHLEDVRKWRNADRNRFNMEFTGTIDQTAQERWFACMDHARNLLFTYHADTTAQGFLQLKNIDPGERTAEAGIIHGEARTLQTTLPVRAIMVLMEAAFDVLGLEKLRAKIKQGNTAAESLNQQLGYAMRAGEEAKAFRYFEVRKAGFASQTARFREAMVRLYGPAFNLSIASSEHFRKDGMQPQQSFEIIDPAYFSSQDQ